MHRRPRVALGGCASVRPGTKLQTERARRYDQTYALVFGTSKRGLNSSEGRMQFCAGRFRQMELLPESVLAQGDGAPR